jgi:hypothetical protein
MGVGRDFTLRSFHLHLSAKPDGTTGANAWLYGFSTRGSLRPWYRRRIGRGRKDQESRSNRYLPGLQPQAVLAPGTPQSWPRSIDPKGASILRSEPALLNNTTLQDGADCGRVGRRWGRPMAGQMAGRGTSAFCRAPATSHTRAEERQRSAFSSEGQPRGLSALCYRGPNPPTGSGVASGSTASVTVARNPPALEPFSSLVRLTMEALPCCVWKMRSSL